jgi:hypothetical protein
VVGVVLAAAVVVVVVVGVVVVVVAAVVVVYIYPLFSGPAAPDLFTVHIHTDTPPRTKQYQGRDEVHDQSGFLIH